MRNLNNVLFLELIIFTQILFVKNLKTYNHNTTATFTCSRMALYTSEFQRVGIL